MRKARIGKTRWAIALVCGIAFSGPVALGQDEDLRVLTDWIEWSDGSHLLQRHLNFVAHQLLESRRAKIARLSSRSDWEARQKETRDTLLRLLGPFPEKSPLNARVTGSVAKEGYRIEKVVLESRPGFYVTGCLFIPERLEGRGPAILNVIGHTAIAFRAASYQRLILNLVNKGFIVFAMDPIGQGERLQYFDPEQGKSRVGGPTREHSYLGQQCFLTGSSAAHYFTWDGIRAIDYLISRPEVDASRIGVTGISGGGTQTTYISAVDDRVRAAAPANYICGLGRLFESIGPQDAEQNVLAGVAAGIDHADFLELRAPKPTLVVATTRDFFSIQGARETVAEASAAFGALGAEQNLSIVEDDHGHGYTKKTREAIYAFFQKHLENPGDPTDLEVESVAQKDLTVTQTGQLADSLGGQTVFSLNRTHAEGLLSGLRKARGEPAAHLRKVREEARRISGYVAPEGPLNAVFRGRYQRAGYSVEKYFMAGEGRTVVPFLFLRPDPAGRKPAVLYLHPEGKSAAADAGGEIEALVKGGFSVLAPDLSGTGEVGPVDDSLAFLGVQTGRSLAGIQAGDIVRCVRFLATQDDVGLISAVARGSMAVPLLHAAVINDRIQKVALVESFLSYQDVVLNRFYVMPDSALIAGILESYDLPDLAAALAPRPLLVLNPQDQLSRSASEQAARDALAVADAAYKSSGQLRIEGLPPGKSVVNALIPWLNE